MVATYTNHGYCSLLLAVFVASLAGCADKKEAGDICSWIRDPSECPETGEETAGDDGTGGGPDDEWPCSTTPDNVARTVFQCNGTLNATIDFKAAGKDCAHTLDDPSKCTESHVFGAGEDEYEMPAVMACCDTIEPIDEDFYLDTCGSDMIQQLCASIPYRLQSYIDNGAFLVGSNQAQKLQNYLAENQQLCFDTFKGATTGTPGVFGTKTWLVNGGKNGDWPLLKDFTITLDDGSVTSFWLPDDESEHLTCYGSDFNNTEFFEGSVPRPPGVDSFAHLTNAGSASLAGPVVMDGRVTALATLASEAGSCKDPWCSFMAVTVDESSRVWTLNELTLNADGVVWMTNGTTRVDVERGAIRLYGQAVGDIDPNPDFIDPRLEVYTIAPRTAQLVISGVSAFAADIRWGTNFTPIKMYKTQNGWDIDAFVVEHVDRADERWTVVIPSTTWE
jgi:hypothetical protein